MGREDLGAAVPGARCEEQRLEAQDPAPDTRGWEMMRRAAAQRRGCWGTVLSGRRRKQSSQGPGAARRLKAPG